jgi:hypothetical protein
MRLQASQEVKMPFISSIRLNKLQSPVIHVVDPKDPVNRGIINTRVLDVKRAVRWPGIISLTSIEKLFFAPLRDASELCRCIAQLDIE